MTSPIAAGNGFSLIHVLLPADLKALEALRAEMLPRSDQ